MGFATAVEVHNFVGDTWLIAFLFFVFWIFTTGEWKPYIPTTKKNIVGRSILSVRDLSRRTPSGTQTQRSQA
jgi:hypothetical protein